jgi:hypothetical protein
MFLSNGQKRGESAAGWARAVARQDEITPGSGFVQSEVELKKAGYVSPETKGA